MQAYVTYLHYWWTKIKGYVLDLIFLFPWFHWIVLLCSSLSASSLQQLGDATMELSFHNAQRCFLLPTKSFILQLILQYALLLSPLGCGKTNLMLHLFVRLKLMLNILLFEEVLASTNSVLMEASYERWKKFCEKICFHLKLVLK